jgi:hypothetical protein
MPKYKQLTIPFKEYSEPVELDTPIPDSMVEMTSKDIPRGGGLRFNTDKTRYDLVPAFAQEQYARVITRGAKKYVDRNWERGMSWCTVAASLERHLAAFKMGEDLDPETGLLHTAHIMCNAAFLTEYYKTYPQGDDRPHTYLETPKIMLDIDEVICDWVGGWISEFDMDVPRSWFFDRNISDRFATLKSSGDMDEFYMNLKPRISPDDLHFEPWCYVTSRPVSTEVTEAWLDKHGFPARPVHTVGVGQSKVDVLKSAGGDIFVDDRFENFVEINNAGISCYLMDAPHNQRYDVGHKRIFKLDDLLTGDHLVRDTTLK